MSNHPELIRGAFRADATPGGLGRLPDFDLADPASHVATFGKLWGSFGEPVLGIFHGAMYASIDGQRAIPLFGYAGTGLTLCRVLENGHLQMRGKETGYFTDLATGEVIDHWDNPFTGQRVEVYPFLNDRIGGELTLEMPRLTVGEATESALMNEGTAPAADSSGTVPFLLPWQVYGDEVLLEWDYAHCYPNPVDPARWPTASTGPTINPSEHFVIYADRREIADPDVPSAHFRAGFSRLSPWWPWMRMGQSGVQGQLFGRLFSRKSKRGIDDIPRPVLDRIVRDIPDYLEAPTDWDLGPILSSWEAFARDVAPEVQA